MNRLPSWLPSSRNSRTSIRGQVNSRARRRRLLLERLEDRALLAGEIFPNDPDFVGQWPLHNTGQTGGTPDADIDAPEAWSVTTGSMATVVAMMDDGFDYTERDLYLNIWLNEGEIPASIAANLTDADGDGIITFRDLNAPVNAAYVTDLNGNGYIDGGDLLADPAWENGIDEDGNGFTDDLIGWDFHDNDNDPWAPMTSHGSPKALIVGGEANNGYGGAGVNWYVRILPMRIYDAIRTSEFNANVVAAIDYTAASDASIIYGGFRGNPPDGELPASEFSQEIYDAIDRTRQAGQLFVAAAGNGSRDTDLYPWYPQSYDVDNVIVAGALSENDDQLQLSSLTNWGAASVDLAVPSYGGATSNAFALLTGVAALLKTAHPDWTYAQIKERIMATVDPTPSLAGKTVTGGRLNAANALGVVNVSISDATATEGSSALKLLDRFVADGQPLWARAGTFGPDGNGDGAADFYLPTVDTSEVLRYDGVTGAFLDVFIPAGSGGLNSPGDLEFTPDGLLYVTSYLGNQLLRYDASTGAFIDVAASGLSAPLGISQGPDGSLYIANQLSNEVLRYDGSALSVFVPAGSDGLAAPRLGLFGPDANGDGFQDLYVAAQDSHQIHRYSGVDGTPISAFVATDPTTHGPMWLGFGTQGDLYLSVRTTSSCCDTSINRYDLGTGALLQSYALGRDGWSFTVGPDGLIYNSTNGDGNFVERFGPSSLAAFTVTLSSASSLPVTVDYSTASGSALAGSDFTAASGTITFAPGQTTRTILVQALDDAVYEGNETFVVNLSNPSSGAIITDTQGVATITDNDPPPTKFYVVNDGSPDRTYEYGPTGAAVENYVIDSGNSAPRGAASTVAGDKVWVVDNNRNVYVYDTSGGLLGAWTAGSLANNADEQGIATNGTDVWIVDAKSDKVFRYTNAAGRLSGSQNAASSFSLNSGNRNPKDIVTDGVHLWVVNDTSTDKVFKYTLSGSLVGSWTISTSGATAPTGITLDPASPSHLWIVDSGSDRVY
ncbi:MAG TPA: S8 family serine peptidase, partial [Pirellulaceae bacterium]|nr:S8 family serine peptidase [Pirellulaceae bacterium]